MTAVCFYFQVHQPYRVKPSGILDIGQFGDYFDDCSDTSLNNQKILAKVASKCYLPANQLILDLIKTHPEFKVSYSLSGTFMDQVIAYQPEVLDSFRKLIDTGRVELLAETHYHSLASLYSKTEFIRQILEHDRKVRKIFGIKPQIFRNTELIYSDDIASVVEGLGYAGILLEGADHVLDWRSPNFIYQPHPTSKIKMLLKDYRLSDDIAFRFSSRDWSEYPLTAEKFASWIHAKEGDVVNLFMDYETLGEHQWAESGIFDFMASLPSQILKNPNSSFVTVSEAVDTFKSVSNLSVIEPISWADTERDLSAWRSNEMQCEALDKLYNLESRVIKSGNKKLILAWRRLQTSDHFYYMCTKWFNDGDVHKYFNPYQSPHEAFIAFMNTLNDLELKLEMQNS